MRPTTFALLALLLAGCGGDDSEAPETFQTDIRRSAEATADDTADAPPPAPDRDGAAREAGSRAASPDPTASESSGSSSEPERADTRAAPSGDERLYTVQIAAFTEPSSAEELEQRLRSEGLPVWTSVTEHGGRTYYRLRVGVVPTVSDARRLGSMITQRYEWPVWVAPLTPADRLPAGAVEATRRLLGTG